MATATDTTADPVYVLEFDLGTDRYCVAIDHVDEIVNRESVTPVPKTPPHVEGVMDLRGETTTILNPKTVLGVQSNGDRRRIVVFEGGADRTVGWLVDEVYQVTTVDPSTVDDSVRDEGIHGIVRRDDEFVVWVSPDAVSV